MFRFRSSLCLALIGAGFLAIPLTHAEVIGNDVDYTHDGDTLRGFVAYDDATEGTRPGILVVHNWMGISEETQRRAKMLAELGYVAFCADIYGVDHRPADTGEAAKVAGVYKEDRNALRARLTAALDQLKQQPQVDQAKLAVIGYCFGGMSALEAARMGAELKGVVSFHGSYSTPTPEDASNIKGKVLICHGYNDPFTKMDEANGLMKELDDAGVDWQMNIYGGAVHSFTDPTATGETKGAQYDPEADQRSWAAMRDFFDEIFAD